VILRKWVEIKISRKSANPGLGFNTAKNVLQGGTLARDFRGSTICKKSQSDTGIDTNFARIGKNVNLFQNYEHKILY